MRILILGGTRFLGRHLAEEARARGHELTLFNRGQTNADLFPEVRRVRGDRRSGAMEQLRGERFDAVFDTSAYHPEDVAATRPFAPQAEHYTLVSTISVYRDPLPESADEAAPLWTLDDPLPREFSTPEQYGGLKAKCEKRAFEIYGKRSLVVRPGLIVGPHDYTDRLTSWMRRLLYRDTVLAGTPDQPLQLIDVRDLAAWMIRATESAVTGTFNAVGPGRGLKFKDFLTRAATALGVSPAVTWAGDQFLIEHQVNLPLWIPRADHAFFELSNARAVAAGLRVRPIEETISRVHAFWQARTLHHDPEALLDEQEDKLLATFAASE